MSSLERCPLFRVSFIERFHYTQPNGCSGVPLWLDLKTLCLPPNERLSIGLVSSIVSNTCTHNTHSTNSTSVLWLNVCALISVCVVCVLGLWSPRTLSEWRCCNGTPKPDPHQCMGSSIVHLSCAPYKALFAAGGWDQCITHHYFTVSVCININAGHAIYMNHAHSVSIVFFVQQ